MMRASQILRQAVAVSVAVGLVSACGGDMDELDSTSTKSRRRPGGRIEPLPEITPYEVFSYIADEQGMRSPFVPDTPQAAARRRSAA